MIHQEYLHMMTLNHIGEAGGAKGEDALRERQISLLCLAAQLILEKEQLIRKWGWVNE